MALQPVNYLLDDGTTVAFEIEPKAGFVPASARDVIGPMRRAVEPLIDSAKLVLATGRAAGEGNFEVTLSWSLRPGQDAQS